jgi:hypothetical protein
MLAKAIDGSDAKIDLVSAKGVYGFWADVREIRPLRSEQPMEVARQEVRMCMPMEACAKAPMRARLEETGRNVVQGCGDLRAHRRSEPRLPCESPGAAPLVCEEANLPHVVGRLRHGADGLEVLAVGKE